MSKLQIHDLISSINAEQTGVIDMLSSSIKFNCGDPSELEDLGSEDFCLPPYKNCLFQFDVGGSVQVIHTLIYDNTLHFSLYCKQSDMFNGQWFKPPYEMFLEYNDEMRIVEAKVIDTETGAQLYGDADFEDKESVVWAINSMYSTGRLFPVMACSNVMLVENKAPKFINKKRLKKGKKPLFSFKTLHLILGESKKKQKNSGGSHASPRIHLRRGHIRRLAAGGRVWVQACVVGDRKKGIVHKDYTVGVA